MVGSNGRSWVGSDWREYFIPIRWNEEGEDEDNH
jgi:hypothetical protein